jgi:processive 1,2-diacylglycerol beta-glucosyltransferase
MGKRVLILTAGAGSGHNVAAAAVEAALEDNPEVVALSRIDVLEYTNRVYQDLYAERYFDLVKAVPWVVGWGYDYLDRPFSNRRALNSVEELMMSRVIQLIRAFKADTVICTHFLPSRMMSLLIARDRLPATMSVVTTDYDFQALWFSSPFNRFYVAREETSAYMISIGLPADRITVSGIPVKPEFSEPVDRAAVLTAHGLDPALPTLLISAGAAGGSYALEIIKQTLTIRQPFQAIIVSGRNEELKAQAQAMVAQRGSQYCVLGYTNQMAALMQAASLFVGKPGGLTASECMAVGLPMVLVNPIPGQEVRNSDFLLEEGAAVRCNYRTTVGYKIDMLLGDPARLARMAENARRIGRPDAAQVVAAGALAEAPLHFWISSGAQAVLRERAAAGVTPDSDQDTLSFDESGALVPLHDAATGLSIGLLTAREFAAMRRHAGDRIDGHAVQVDDGFVEHLARQRAGGDVVSFFRQMMGDVTDVLIRWPD